MFLIFLVSSCQREEVFEKAAQKTVHKNAYTVKTLHAEEIRSNGKITGILKKLASSTTGGLQRIGGTKHNAEYGFTVYTAVSNYVKIDSTGAHSYQFFIQMDNPNDKFLENLLLSSDGKGGYNAFIVHYGFTSNELLVMKKGELESTNIAYLPINFDYGDIMTGKEMFVTMCLEIQGYQCERGGCDCDCEWVTVASGCATFYGGGFSGGFGPMPSTDGIPGGGGGGGDGGNDGPDNDGTECHGGCPPEITVPVPNPEYDSSGDYVLDIIRCLDLSIEAWEWMHEDLNGDGNLDNFLDVRDLAGFLVNNNCSSESQAFGEEAAEAMANDEMTPEELDIAIQLFNELKANPFLLLEIDCDQIQHWQDLAQHTPPQSVEDKIENLQENHDAMLGDWDIQYLDEAGGTVVNMDYFAVNITSFPTDPTTGQPFTPNDFLDYFRNNINNFCSPTTFEPYCEISAICQQETNLWNSSYPLGALVKLNIPLYDGWGGDTFGNDGVIICSEFQNDYWYFMTIEAPYDDNHPVSGTRQFGYEINVDGSYDFFVRGVDRFNSGAIFSVLDFFKDNPFFGADDLWETFQEEIDSYVNSNGGSASIEIPITNRPDWEMVEDVLMGNRPIGDLGCN